MPEEITDEELQIWLADDSFLSEENQEELKPAAIRRLEDAGAEVPQEE